jgi:hypothetical protein
VAADRKLAQKEQNLLTRRGSLQRERASIRNRRAELLTRKLTLAEDDTAGKQALEAEESKLVQQEAGLVEQEMQLNQKLEALLQQKDSIVGKLNDERSKVVLLGRREQALAHRERDLARRESDLARREKTLAEREQGFAARQAKVCPRATTIVQTVPSPRSNGNDKYTRRDVEPTYRAALEAMRKNGILTVDLPAGVDRLVTETRHAVAKRDYARAKFAADQLLASVRAIKIDRAFIGAKIGRLSRAMKKRKVPGKRKQDIASLFQKATASYGDGHFGDANRKLNRIYALLR